VTVTDFLDEKRREITKRLTELKPLVEEFNRLEAAAAALAGAVGSAASEAAGAVVDRRGPGRPRRASRRKKAAKATATATATEAAPKAARKPGRPAKRRAGRRKGNGTRAAQALSLVQGQPGITTPELAVRMGIATNYLYRVLPVLEQEGKVRKEGRGWHAAAS
jgi:ribosomal protein S25